MTGNSHRGRITLEACWHARQRRLHMCLFSSITIKINTKSRSDFIKAVWRLLGTSSKLLVQNLHKKKKKRHFKEDDWIFQIWDTHLWLFRHKWCGLFCRCACPSQRWGWGSSFASYCHFPARARFQFIWFILFFLQNYAHSMTTNTVRHSKQRAWKTLFTASCKQSFSRSSKSRDLSVMIKVAQSWIPDVFDYFQTLSFCILWQTAHHGTNHIEEEARSPPATAV